MTSRSIEILGVSVTPYTISQLNGLIRKCIDADERRIIAHQNLHGVYYYYRDKEIRSFFLDAHYVHVDSMPMILLAKFMGSPVQRSQRVTFVDWTMPLFQEASSHGWRVFYLGSRPGVALRGRRVLEKQFSHLDLVVQHGYFNDTPGHRENEDVINRINDFGPHVLMVGMGMPRQERWIMRNFPRLHANVIMNCGACIDYVAGVTPTPPRWLGRIGLEWLCRLMYEPRRLWKRSFYEPLFLLRLLLKDLHAGFSRRRCTAFPGKKERDPLLSPKTRNP